MPMDYMKDIDPIRKGGEAISHGPNSPPHDELREQFGEDDITHETIVKMIPREDIIPAGPPDQHA